MIVTNGLLTHLTSTFWTTMSGELCLNATTQLENIDELKKVLQLIWDQLPQDSINKAILSFQKRLRACVKASVGHFEDTIRYNSVYLTCSKKLMGSQLSPPHGTNKTLKCETKNKTMSMIGPVQSRCHEGSPVGKRSLRWEGFVEKVGFESGVKQ